MTRYGTMQFSALRRDSSIGLRVLERGKFYRRHARWWRRRAAAATLRLQSQWRVRKRSSLNVNVSRGAARGGLVWQPLARAERRFENGSEWHNAQAMIPHSGNEAEDLSAME
jgi:hypothetical protein